MPRKQDGNLKKGNPPTQFKSGREAAEAGRKGGIASGEAKRARKSLRNELDALLNMPAKDKDGNDSADLTVQGAIAVALVKQALKGNTKAFEIIRDTIGEKPVERVALGEIDQDTIAMVEKMVMDDDSKSGD